MIDECVEERGAGRNEIGERLRHACPCVFRIGKLYRYLFSTKMYSTSFLTRKHVRRLNYVLQSGSFRIVMLTLCSFCLRWTSGNILLRQRVKIHVKRENCEQYKFINSNADQMHCLRRE